MKHKTVVFTIGHSTRTLSEFTEILKKYGVDTLLDIRTIPRSRHNPQFNEQHLAKALKKEHIQYMHIKVLGGLRRAHADSINMAWRNASFRGYADYMQTALFRRAIKELVGAAKNHTIALMCAEAVPWRCHRSMIADALVVRHVTVEHIMDIKHAYEHTLNPMAKVHRLRVFYPAQ